MALRMYPTEHDNVKSNWPDIETDILLEMASVEWKTRDMEFEIFNDVPYANLLEDGFTKRGNSGLYTGRKMLEVDLDTKIMTAKLPIEDIFSRKVKRADMIQKMNRKMGEIVNTMRKKPPTPIYSGMLAKGSAHAEKSKIDKRYRSEGYIGWGTAGPKG